ncbi:hypothetical protein TSUD_363160 [Trifolium subterraneum]|uniref:Pectinesterase catalytic domain-containing protein n=1 Tax=Trifolium subterraneum TaxID=3900 RepID=A0A2Z6M0H0_TRISU|nr:hypothetical protein TSUD_363160 [Trifolium subterraneum]
MQPNATVAKDGSGQYTTVTDDINSYPTNYQGRYIIYVKAGIYQEYVTVDQSKHNILLYGDDPNKTIITGDKNQKQRTLNAENCHIYPLKDKAMLWWPAYNRFSTGILDHQ